VSCGVVETGSFNGGPLVMAAFALAGLVLALGHDLSLERPAAVGV